MTPSMTKKALQLFQKAKLQNQAVKLYCKDFALPNLKISTFYQNYSSDIKKVFLEIFLKQEVSQKLQDLLAGKIVNHSEQRAALHHYYRNPNFKREGFDLVHAVETLEQKITKEKYQNVFMFGIGGSFEGPKLLLEAISIPKNLNIFFITGPDKDEFNSIVKPRLTEKNLYLFASKSFTTDETLLTYSWLPKDLPKEHFVGITSNPSKARELGLLDRNILIFPETVGGRYSIWSPISAAVLDKKSANAFLKGARVIDDSIKSKGAAFKAIQEIVFYDLWSHNFQNKDSRVVLTYNWKLRSLTNYIQQLEMESLGKQPASNSIFQKTGQTIYGGFGSTAQHSYFQLLHQGTSNTVADVVHAKSSSSKLLNAQAEGQAKLLAGKIKYTKGSDATNSNIPVNFFALKNLSPESLGSLIALWEYRVFVTAAMLNINPFDQFGVNAGKKVAQRILSK
jgi:glucose-6-phosphate isomerase